MRKKNFANQKFYWIFAIFFSTILQNSYQKSEKSAM